MKKHFQIKEKFDFQLHLGRAMEEVQHFTATFVHKEKNIWVGSGTFVNACGHNGILTAHHVAEPILESEFGLCIANHEHALLVNPKHCQHVPIGHIHNNPDEESGPDLSFVIIRDVNLLASLKSKKSFCHLDTKDLEFFESPLERMNWCISGSPNEASKIEQFPAGRLGMFKKFIGEALFQSRIVQDGFDFIKLRVPSGQDTYPADYGGMSGGGMWVVPLSMEEGGGVETIRHEAPILAGVSFYQSAVESGDRIITGHGYDSIYSRVRQTLREL